MSETIAATGPVDRAPPTGAPASDVDPFSLNFFADPFPAYHELRQPGRPFGCVVMASGRWRATKTCIAF
jgi:hypothetical protein